MLGFVIIMGLIGAALLPTVLVKAIVKGVKGERTIDTLIWAGILSCMLFYSLFCFAALATS